MARHEKECGGICRKIPYVPTSQGRTSETGRDITATRDPITMDFVSDLPKTRQNHDSVWVIVDRLTKSAHFLPVNNTYTMDKLAELYVQNIVRLHGVPKSIVLDRDSRFTSKFWRSLQNTLGAKLKFSTTYHAQIDG